MLKFTINITTQEMYTVIPVHVLMKCQLNTCNNCYMSKKSMHTSVCENDVYFSISSNFTTRSDLYQSDATYAGGSWEKNYNNNNLCTCISILKSKFKRQRLLYVLGVFSQYFKIVKIG